MTSLTLWADLTEMTALICTRWNLPTITLEAWNRGKAPRCFGEAHVRERPPKIRLRLHCYGRPRRPLAESTIWATLAHELGHFVPGAFHHGPAHREATLAIAHWLRQNGKSVDTRLNI